MQFKILNDKKVIVKKRNASSFRFFGVVLPSTKPHVLSSPDAKIVGLF